jgi:membrane dipeptidase
VVVDAEFLSVFVPPMLYPGDLAYTQSLVELDAIDALVAANQTSVVLARTAASVRAAAAVGKTVVSDRRRRRDTRSATAPTRRLLQHLQSPLRAGARYMTLTWSNSNRLGGSSGDDGKGRGLTPLGGPCGRRDERSRHDGRHLPRVSDATFFDAVHASRLPVLASHSSARALADRPRNMTDPMLRAVADNGGAVCVNFGPEFLDAEWAKQLDALQAAAGIAAIFERARVGSEGRRSTIHLAQAQGRSQLRCRPSPRRASSITSSTSPASQAIDHVCLGSDFDGVPAAPDGARGRLEDAVRDARALEARILRQRT